jgi:cell cycle sensor histidine kinase DivJ
VEQAPASEIDEVALAAEPQPTPIAAVWQLGWAAGVLGCAAMLLICFGIFNGALTAALIIGMIPGVFGYFWRPRGKERLGLLALWALAVAMAASIQGGAAGPLGVWALMPLIVGALIGLAAEGAVLSFAALAAMVLVGLSNRTGIPPEGAFGVGVAAVGVLTAGGAAAVTVALLMRRAASAERKSEGLHYVLSRNDSHALERRLQVTEVARDRALNALAEAESARAAAEAVAAAADASAQSKSRFLANMSHELRTPLNAIMGFSDIMRARLFGDLPGKYAEYAELIHESGRHLTDLINDVLDMSKIEAERYVLHREEFDIREPIGAALRLMRLQADDVGVQLRGVLPQSEVLVDADRRAVKQIVLNLVSNALKFTPAGGSVTVTAQAAGGAFELVVADTGVGIAKEDLSRLGRPFEQAGDSAHKIQGTGLGLSLVRAFAQLHGGEMTIESELGEGAAITVRLPVLIQEPAEAPPIPAVGRVANDQGPNAPAAQG